MHIDPRTIINETQDDGLSKRAFHAPIPQKSDIKIPRFHWTRDKVDIRDYKYVPTKAKVSNIKDLRVYCSPIENQGNLGSCTGQAIAGAIELLNKRNKKPNDISRLFIYYYERQLINTINYDSGAYIRDGIKVTSKQGAPIEPLWPYIINKYRIQPNATAIKDAAKRKVTLYERVADFNGCIDAISNGFPVVVGFDVYSSFNNIGRSGIMTYPNVNVERQLGGHAVLLVGYDNNKGYFIARNSWGAGWGDKGYFYMPFDVIQNTSMSADFWVIKSVNNP